MPDPRVPRQDEGDKLIEQAEVQRDEPPDEESWHEDQGRFEDWLDRIGGSK